MTTEERYDDLCKRAKATGLWVAIVLSLDPKADEGDWVELPPLRLRGDDGLGLAKHLDIIETALADWEAHPESPRVGRVPDSFLRGVIRGIQIAQGAK